MTDKPKWLQKLHRDVIKNLQRYFDWDYGAQDTWGTDRFPPNLKVRVKGYLQKYGTPMIGEMFRPHITLTSFEDKGVVDQIPPLKFQRLAFHIDTIHVCELGPSHSCQRIVRARMRSIV